MKHTFNILFQKDNDGYFVFCPELKGCHSQGDSFEDAKANIKEAIELYLETMSQDEIDELLKTNDLISTTIELSLA